MSKRYKIKSFQFLPESLTIIERLETNEAKGRSFYQYFMPIEECGRAFVLACKSNIDENGSSKYDDLAVYEVNYKDFNFEFDYDNLVVIRKKFLYNMLEKAGFTPEQDSFESDEKQKVLHEAFLSALG